MHESRFEEALDLICAKDIRYDREAYYFIREALDYTQEARAKDERAKASHVSGKELLEGIRDYCLRQFGPMTITVLEAWGIRSCEDFGEIVFNMVEARWLTKTKDDSRADFQGGYDFVEAFRNPYLPSSRLPRPETVASGS